MSEGAKKLSIRAASRGGLLSLTTLREREGTTEPVEARGVLAVCQMVSHPVRVGSPRQDKVHGRPGSYWQRLSGYRQLDKPRGTCPSGIAFKWKCWKISGSTTGKIKICRHTQAPACFSAPTTTSLNLTCQQLAHMQLVQLRCCP